MIVCKEMELLRKGLDDRQIPWEDKSNDDNGDSYWICRTHFWFKGNKWSVVNGYGTYGGIDCFSPNNQLLLECMVGNEEPIGWLHASDVFMMMEVDE